MLKAVVFDMDNTLLDINLGAFVAVYMRDEARLIADICQKNSVNALASLSGILIDLVRNRRRAEDDRTNHAFYIDELRRRCQLPLDDPIIGEAFSYYEREVLPLRNSPLINARPREGAHRAIQTVADRGLRIALLTNPGFTRDCIECRMKWGEIDDAPFELVTTMENSTRCKPDIRYYLESLDVMGLSPEEVLMVGNDAQRDFPVPDCGIQTAFVGNRTPERALWSGSMADFAKGFDEIEERFYKRQEQAAMGTSS